MQAGVENLEFLPGLLRRNESDTVIADDRRARRYAIWRLQAEAGREPCFGTPARFVCNDTDCIFRFECLGLRAHWRR